MSEISKNKKQRYAIDPIPFVVALILGPIVALLIPTLPFLVNSGWDALYFSAMILMIGGPFYLVIGTPVLLIYLKGNQGRTGEIALLALASNVIATLVGIGLVFPAQIIGLTTYETYNLPLFIGACGVLFAPLWGFGFGLVYNFLRGDASRMPTTYAS